MASAQNDDPASAPAEPAPAPAVLPRSAPSIKPKLRYQASQQVPHLTPDERVARGRAARREVPRSSHASFEPSTLRADPIALLELQGKSRVQDLLPIRYGRMVSSPFAFFRGAALGMAADLAGTPSSGLRVQVCGDAHLSNFGVFASPERQLVFDLNDFDETTPGPWEWDVKRLAASLDVAGRANTFTAADRRTVVLASVAEYRTAMLRFAAMNTLDVWYQHLPVETLLTELRTSIDPTLVKNTEKILAKAKTRDHLQAFSKLVRIDNGEPRFISDPPLLVPVHELLPELDAESLEHQIRGSLRSYRTSLTSDRKHLLEEFRFVELARKVVGVGSVGTRAWVVLMLGRDANDPLLLQIKEAQTSVLENFVGRSVFNNAGQRVVAGQRLMQASSDIFLGWQRLTGFDGETRDFYVRQLRDWKGSVEVEQMGPRGMEMYARMCGWTLARAHARSGDRIAIAAYLGKGTVFDSAVADFASAYADQNERDHATLVEAIASGRVVADERF